MAVVGLNLEPVDQQHFALFNLGFRPFFLGAGLFGAVAMVIWLLNYSHHLPLNLLAMPSWQWHAHEMIYGYTMAVVAGFLLTAVKNWTGVQTIRGPLLALFVALWFLARLVMLLSDITPWIWLMAIQLLFLFGLVAAVAWPVVKVRQWSQLSIVLKLLLIGVSELLFWLGIAGVVADGEIWGLYSALYLILSLLLLMLRRVGPFFIERGLDNGFKPKNYRTVDIGSMVAMLLLRVTCCVLFQFIVIQLGVNISNSGAAP
ncbi:NnrS family protein [Ectothiorhodospiraceae bacterium BW-2]|nr:NnrS family protein [Ectothiorhodospiraceae bacterium BW-2]